ncbi:DUF1048 domain-containing protein [Adlercreutzia sp. R21]|uniref:DUF1048 domain-containing protein n=1 Tax=Adlercreutzia wanghongyangiae TaxID=3111451 RepID=UPI002DB6E0D5|nr:DUF1048 domain-containing protein [Adlercreutzia sp. R21]MEC4183452.1 DUF1048 domain-containing protein [Adlercreutzia sp. R21]
MTTVKQFFNDYINPKRMLEGKRAYREMMARVDALPEDYRFVFKKIQDYMWKFASGNGYDMIEVQEGLVSLFEEGAAEGKPVLDITGEDVSGFADELMKEVVTYTEQWSDNLNADIAKKLG